MKLQSKKTRYYYRADHVTVAVAATRTAHADSYMHLEYTGAFRHDLLDNPQKPQQQCGESPPALHAWDLAKSGSTNSIPKIQRQNR